MNNQPDQPQQAFPDPSDKLVLPAPPGQESDGQTNTGLTRPVPSLGRVSSPASRGPFFPFIRSLWRQEPARVIGLAIALVLAASIVLVALGASTLLHSTSSRPPQTPSAVTPAPALTVQMTGISDRVENGTMVHVQVQTSKPDLSVKLLATYQVSPFSSTSKARTTDGNGQATIDWPVNISSFIGSTQATVIVVATDQNGRQVMSNPVTVMIMTNPHGKGHNHDNNNGDNHDNNN